MSNCVVRSGGLRLPCSIIAKHSVEGCDHFSHPLRIAEIMAVGAERAEVTAEEIILEEARLQLDKTTVDAIAEMSQQANGALLG
jgi:hypothetical protein